METSNLEDILYFQIWPYGWETLYLSSSAAPTGSRFFLGNIEAYSSEPSYLLDRYGNPGFWFGTCGINHDLFHHYWVFRQFHLFSLLGMGWNWVISAATGWGHRTWNFGDFTTEDAGFAQKENGSLHTLFLHVEVGNRMAGQTSVTYW